MIDLIKNYFNMSQYIDTNLKVIKKHLKKRIKLLSKQNVSSIMEEFREWSDVDMPEKEFIWTLPDLTRVERFNNFCRSIKKEIK